MPLCRKGNGRDLNIERDEMQALTEHARWLVDYHNRRGESVAQRAVAVLGFTGVILAIIPASAAVPRDLTMTVWLWATLGVSAALLLTTAVLSVITISRKRTGAPSVLDARTLLHQHTTGKRRGRVHGDIAHQFLHALSLRADSPVDKAYEEADLRARAFKWSSGC